MNFEDLTEEQKKVRECKTPEDLLALAEEEGYELSGEEFEAVAGGAYIYCEVRQCGSF